jgi:CRISPR-associated protein Cmr2
MREMIQGLLNEGISPDQILTPSSGLPEKPYEAGYYADRLILASKPGDFEKLLSVKDAVIEKMSAEMATDLRAEEQALATYLKQYFQVYCFEENLDPGNLPFKRINEVLNGLELQKRFPRNDQDYFVDFLNQKKSNFLIKDAFSKNIRFRSVIEISTGELKELAHKEYSNVIEEELNKANPKEEYYSDVKGEEGILKKFAKASAIKDSLMSYHKYIAIVHADGDGFGAYINKRNDSEFKSFSDQLFSFSQEAKEIIKRDGGAPIYIGGDDLLFLAPVAEQVKLDGGRKKVRTVFHTIKEVDTLFKAHFPDDISFSYGVSFTYYKFPLNEARSLSSSLERDAKELPGKNAVAFKLRKHSGASFGGAFSKNGVEFNQFLELIDALSSEEKFLSTFIHRLGFHEETLKLLLKGEQAKERIGFFFENNFDEAVHQKERELFVKIADYLWNVSVGAKPDEAVKKLYSTLRFIHFLRSKENEE